MSTGLVSTDEARSLLSGEGCGCGLAEAVRVGQDVLTNAVSYADSDGSRARAVETASDALGSVERLARTVILLRSREAPSAATKASLEAELALHRQDLAEAAGELMVPVPPPDSMAAKLMRSNRILRSMHDESHREVRRLQALLTANGIPYDVPDPAPEE